jgi:hypothetical protein
MAHPYHHCLSSIRKWGGEIADYLPLHSWFDQSKSIAADFRHRALRHHAEGIFIIPSFADWMPAIRPLPWMGRSGRIGDPPQLAPQIADGSGPLLPS